MIRKLFIALAGISSIAAAQDYAPHAPFPQPPGKLSRFTFDVHGYYGFNAAPSSTYSADMVGIELGGAYYLTPRQAVTLSLAIAGDTEEEDCYDCPFSDPYDRSDFSLLAGYRFTQPIGRYMSLTLGAKGGLDVQHLLVRNYCWDPHNRWYHEYNTSGTRCGFGYAGYAELGVRISPRTRLTVGYQYHGATTKPVAEDHLFDERYSAKDMRWHEVRIGVDFCF